MMSAVEILDPRTPPDANRRDRDRDDATSRRQQRRFRHQESNESNARHPERESHRDLPTPLQTSCEQQVRNVRAADEQDDDRDGDEQLRDSGLRIALQLFRGKNGPHVDPNVLGISLAGIRRRAPTLIALACAFASSAGTPRRTRAMT